MNLTPSDMPILIAALGLGLTISLHCIGMCGPIALALPGQKAGHTFTRQLLGRLLYNGGRILTYMILGAVFGAFGKLFVFAGLQQGLSIATGVIILLALFTPKRYVMASIKLPAIGKIYRLYKQIWARFFTRDSLKALFIIGLINGLLPCGAVYVALAGAAGTGSSLMGVAFMAMVGIGTSVTMLPMSLASSCFGQNSRHFFRRVMPVTATCLAFIFILRGLNLGIPYLSPNMTKVQSNIEQGTNPAEASGPCPHCTGGE